MDSIPKKLLLQIKMQELQEQEATAPRCSEKIQKKTKKKKLLWFVSNGVNAKEIRMDAAGMKDISQQSSKHFYTSVSIGLWCRSYFKVNPTTEGSQWLNQDLFLYFSMEMP